MTEEKNLPERSHPEVEEEKEETQINLLKERLTKSEEQTKELEDRLLRLAAEFDN